MSTIISEQELFEKTGYSDRGWLEKWLKRERIRYWRARDGQILTTVGLMEAAALGKDVGRERAARTIRFANGKA